MGISGCGRRFGGALTAVTAALAAVVLLAGPAAAAPVSIHDDSHVLDVTRVQNEAATLPDPVEIYTTVKDADDKAAFDRETQAKVTGPTVVVIAVNTQSRHLAIRTGAKSRVTQAAAATATQAFIDSYRGNSDYTAATIAALGSIGNAIKSGGGTHGTAVRPRAATPSSSSGSLVGGLLCLLVVALAAVAIVVVLRRRRRSGPGPGRGYGGGGFGQQGYAPAPGYGPDYGPGYGQPGRSGINPWVAGGVGAAAGGLLGYELGREEGRDEERSREERYDQGNDPGYDDGGFGGGGADGDFGDSGGDF